MILEKQSEILVLEEGEAQGSVDMEIDKESHAFIMKMLSKFYSDAIGSLIRETASNALDSHRECDVDVPIIVALKQTNDGNYEFSVEDVGCGIDDGDVENIIKKYGKSTKRLSASQLGCYGLGFKSPLAYTSSFYFIGRKDGIERKWMLYENDDETNKIDLLFEAPTTERNGVKIVVPVEYRDKNNFVNKIKEQLAYFENVYFNVPDIKNEDVKIVRSKHFQWSSLSGDRSMHICLDDVYYPLDFSKIGISRIDFPVGLRFSLTDGLYPTPNREAIKYSEEAKKLILSKIAQVAEYFVKKYNSTIKDTDDIFKIIEYYDSNNRYIPHIGGFGNIDISTLEVYSSINFIHPKLKGLKYLKEKDVYNQRSYLLLEYVSKYNYYNGRFNLLKNGGYHRRFNLYKSDVEKTYIFTELSTLKKAYLRDMLGQHQRTDFIRKEKKIPLGSRYTLGQGMTSYMAILGLRNHPKSEWRDRIKEYQHIISLITSLFIDADKITIPQEWLDGRKKERVKQMVVKGTNIRKKKLSGEIIGKAAYNLGRYVSGKNCKFVSTTIQMEKAHSDKLNPFTIYGGSESEGIFQKLFSVLDKKKVRILMLSNRELKNLKKIELHNWMEIGKFMEGKHIIFKRAATAYLIKLLINEYTSVFDRYSYIGDISTPLYKKVHILNEYANKYHLEGSDELYKEILQVAENKGLFDTSIYDVYKEVKYIFERLPFINIMFSKIKYGDERLIQVIRDLFKYYKQRIDWQHYKLPAINEEQVEENEELTNN